MAKSINIKSILVSTLAILDRIRKREIVKVFSLNAVSTLIRMLTGFVSVKIVAGLIGPSGIALLGQLQNFSSIFLTISTGGINGGITKYVAEYSGSTSKVNSILRTAGWITLVMSATCGVILLIGSQYFANLILHDIKYTSIIAIFGLTLIFYAFNSMLLAILNGYKEFRKYVSVNIISSAVGLIFTSALAWKFGVYGALLSAVTFQSIVFIVTIVIIVRCPWFRFDSYLGKFSKTAFLRLGQYSIMALVSAVVVPVSQILIRGHIVENTSLADAGIWEGMNRISQMYLMVIISSLSVYYLPRLSEIKSQKELRNEIFSTYKLVIPPLVVMSLLIFYLRATIISILFNDEFQKMQGLFAFQLAGDFCKVTSWILAYQMIAKSMTVTFISTEIIFCSLNVGLAMIFVGDFGNVGATIGYFITYLMYLITMVVIFRKTLQNG